MAPDVMLSTAPGTETHWGQLLFPLPATIVEPGDLLRFNLTVDSGPADQDWRWWGEIRRANGSLHPFVHHCAGEPLPQSAPESQTRQWNAKVIATLNEQAAEAFQTGDFAGAAQILETAVSGLSPGTMPWAGDLYENLGLAYLNADNPAAAIVPFMRALDGDPSGREQSLRFLVDACYAAQRHSDALQFLSSYELHFGAHPSGWTSTGKDG